MPDAFQADKAGSAKAVINLELTGDEGGEFALDIADGKCEVHEALADPADVKVTMSAADFALLTKGRLNPVQAFMGGKIKISGNVGMVMQMLNWFNLG
jgi:putative sterol carrier protein